MISPEQMLLRKTKKNTEQNYAVVTLLDSVTKTRFFDRMWIYQNWETSRVHIIEYLGTSVSEVCWDSLLWAAWVNTLMVDLDSDIQLSVKNERH